MAIWLSEADVRAVLSMRDLIDVMESAVTAFSAGRVKQPVRTVIETPGGFYGTMPAYMESPAAMGAKLVTVYHETHTKDCRRTWRPSSCSIQPPAHCSPPWTAVSSPKPEPLRSLR